MSDKDLTQIVPLKKPRRAAATGTGARAREKARSQRMAREFLKRAPSGEGEGAARRTEGEEQTRARRRRGQRRGRRRRRERVGARKSGGGAEGVVRREGVGEAQRRRERTRDQEEEGERARGRRRGDAKGAGRRRRRRGRGRAQAEARGGKSAKKNLEAPEAERTRARQGGRDAGRVPPGVRVRARAAAEEEEEEEDHVLSSSARAAALVDCLNTSRRCVRRTNNDYRYSPRATKSVTRSPLRLGWVLSFESPHLPHHARGHLLTFRATPVPSRAPVRAGPPHQTRC